MTIHEKMMKIQTTLKAPKNLFNSFGNYKYRNAEGILEAVKPLLAENKLSMYISDDVQAVNDRVYVKATVSIFDIETGESVMATASAREALNKKGMDDSQITGTASSYARKYALNGIFLLDDTKDADTDENQKERKARADKQTDDNNAEAIRAMKISKIKQDTLLSLCDEMAFDINKILASYHHKDISEITEGEYQYIVANKDKANVRKIWS
ncbi:ERF family protein [Anaerostipes hadrus]|uniref:ERF family protein n=1 Tax=Anaerostipes hadrus TaxID=649756 RepID=UPI0015704207|nr:ERF family protein [Anaerostipes hadrus]NSH29979.1 ERF family protein [Anaerostipes hadrus]